MTNELIMKFKYLFFVSKNIQMSRIRMTERLVIASNAFLARIQNANLPPLVGTDLPGLSLSAGLPHFAEGFNRVFFNLNNFWNQI
jgi:hypothetical protein